MSDDTGDLEVSAQLKIIRHTVEAVETKVDELRKGDRALWRALEATKKELEEKLHEVELQHHRDHVDKAVFQGQLKVILALGSGLVALAGALGGLLAKLL